MRHESSPDRGQEVLCRLRNRLIDDPIVRKEADAIMQAIEIESNEEGSWMDLFRDGGISANKRFFLALGIQFMQQLSGINIVTYVSKGLNAKNEKRLWELKSDTVRTNPLSDLTRDGRTHVAHDVPPSPSLVLPGLFPHLVHHRSSRAP